MQQKLTEMLKKCERIFSESLTHINMGTGGCNTKRRKVAKNSPQTGQRSDTAMY